MHSRRGPVVVAMLAGLSTAGAAASQVVPASQRSVGVRAAASSLVVTAPAPSDPGTPVLLWSTELYAVESEWVRVEFGDVQLAQAHAAPDGAYLVIESILDGARQRLDAQSLREWGLTSAYFNGPGVRVELWSRAGLGASSVDIKGLIASIPPRADRSICGPTDDRLPSTDNRTARSNQNCTAWMINDLNTGFLSAGHCRPTGTTGTVVEFNVPLSTASGTPQAPPPDDQYPADPASMASTNGGLGNDYWYFGVFPNANHGQLPVQRYGGARYTLATAAPATGTPSIRVTGYGVVGSPISPTRNQTQQTHAGPYVSLSGTVIRYTPDTTGGNSGSAVLNEATQEAIGIHTNAGCTSTGGSNSGCAIQAAGLQSALNNPVGVNASGRGTPGGTTFLVGDQQNNFGTLRVAPNNFARLAQIGARWQGMAWSQTLGAFYAIDAARVLHTITPAGVSTPLGTVSGVTLTITGLAFDPVTGTLLGVVPSLGQLVRIDTGTLVTTPVGGPQPGIVRGIEYDVGRGVLWGIDETGGVMSLVRIDRTTGVRSSVGLLGIAGTGCEDLAVRHSDGALLSLDAATGNLLSINPGTGAASVLGLTRGVYGSAYGLSDNSPAPSAALIQLDAPIGINDTSGTGNSTGRIDPGESGVVLSVPLRNAGLSGATSVSGTLVAITPGVVVSSGAVSFGPMGSGATASRTYTLSVPASHPCGAPIDLRLDLDSDSVLSSIALSLPTGNAPVLGAPASFAYAGPVVAIPDNSPASPAQAGVSVSGLSGVVGDIDVRIEGSSCSNVAGATTVGIDHPNVGDLIVTLVSPGGYATTLMSRAGGGGNNLCNTVFDDGATASIQTVDPNAHPFSASFRPATPLSVLSGLSPNGTWTLRVSDNAATNTGSIRAFSLVLRTLSVTACTPPNNTCRADFNGVGGVTVQDIFDFLAAWFAGDIRADFNGVNGVTVQDVFDFLAAWFTGC